MLIFAVCVATGVVVFSAMVCSVLRHHRSAGANAARFHRNAAVEIAWTLIPLAIVVAMAIPAMRVLLAPEESPAASGRVTGHPLNGEYGHPGEAARFVADPAIAQQRVRELEEHHEHFLRAVDTATTAPDSQPLPVLPTASEPTHHGWPPGPAVQGVAAAPGLACERDARRVSADEAGAPMPFASTRLGAVGLGDKGWCS